MLAKLLLILLGASSIQFDLNDLMVPVLEYPATTHVAQADPEGIRNLPTSSQRTDHTQHGKSEQSFTINFKNYNYTLYTPANYDSATAVPLVIAVSDINTRILRFMHYIRFNQMADRYGYLVAYPDVYKDKALLQEALEGDGTAAAGLMQQLVDDVAQQRNIRKDKIYLVGFSSGGVIVLNALCNVTMDIAGFAVVAASLPTQSSSHCRRSRQQIAALFMAGRDDPYMRWQMGDSRQPRTVAGVSIDLLPVVTTVEYWTRRNQCDVRPLMTAMANTDLHDGTSVTRLSYDGHCVSGLPVILYAVTGGGHTWPGNQYRPSVDEAGKTSRDIDASNLIWRFFETVQEPPATDKAKNR